MKKHNTLKNQITRRILPIACATTLVMSFTVSQAHADFGGYDWQSDHVTPPPVPGDIQVPEGNKAFLKGHAEGFQNYICLPSSTGFKFILFTPQATLFNDDHKQLTTHFFSPNPEEDDTVRAAWQHSRDTSTVWGRVVQPSSDPNFVEPGAIPWLLIERAGAKEGPNGGHKLTGTTYIQRLNTSGGVAPSTGCESEADVGKQAFEPYEADYFFYKKAYKHDMND